jgi:hypothetical protein
MGIGAGFDRDLLVDTGSHRLALYAAKPARVVMIGQAGACRAQPSTPKQQAAPE